MGTEPEMLHLIWNFILTAGAAAVGWWVINQANELKRIEILLSIYAKGERPSGSSDPYALRRAGR